MDQVDAQSQGFPPNEHIQRFDGQNWRTFDIQGGYVVITAEGEKLAHKRPDILNSLRKYKLEAKQNIGPDQATTRIYFKSGGNADVYTILQKGVVVKENSASSGYSLWSSLDRMDYLHSICEDKMPDHIRVPKHYGVIMSRDLKKQYLIMEQINAGLNVADILNPDIDSHLQVEIMNYFKLAGYNNMSYSEMKRFVKNAYDDAKEKLDKAITKAYEDGKLPYDQLLTDWAEGNVIVDFDRPTEDLPFTLWVIDQ